MQTSSLDRPLLLDEILSRQSENEVQVPLIAYPREGTVADFELFTASNLDALVERAARYYHSAFELEPSKSPIISLVGPSDLDYFITKFALSRLGFGVLLLSTRLSPDACLKLMRENKSQTVVQSSSTLSFALGEKTHALDDTILVIPLATGHIYRDAKWDAQPRIIADRDAYEAQHETAIVYHSSGSTGLPKSIATSHAKLLSPIPTGQGTKALTSSPLCHAFASKLTINSMMVGKCMYLASASMPLTAENLDEALHAASPDVFLTVPYVLKLLAETQKGVMALYKCKQVVSSGSTLSDELGDRLVHEGVNVETLFAGTEPGLVGTSMNRPPGDMAWDYIRLAPAIQKNTQYKPLGGNTFEFVYLKTLPTLNMSNSDDPPGSFHSSDIFSPHPTIAHAWKYVGRIDDRVTLSTGEKVLPLPMEGRVREEPLVREAVVFGIDRAIPGLLVFRSDAARDLSDEDFVRGIWPSVEMANSTTEAFARITKEMIVCIPAGAFVPAADKESIIRAKVYKLYETEAEAAYARLEQGPSEGLVLNIPDLEQLLVSLIRTELGLALADSETDFHRAGMDSLHAIRLRSLVLKKIAVGKPLSQNVVFDAGNAERLARIILSTTEKGDGSARNGPEELSIMQEMITKYSQFSYRESQYAPSETHTVLLTGTTGSLGAHLLAQLLASPLVSRIYCIVRGRDPAERVRESLRSRQLLAAHFEQKATIISGDLNLPDLGVGRAVLHGIRHHLTHIIHAAWPVNFQLGLRALEPQLETLHTLIEMSLSNDGATGPRLLFCSSVSAATATPLPATILEEPISSLSHASSHGYAQSKLVGERMLEAAVAHKSIKATNLRIGQVVGDTKAGVWNASEAWPLIIRSALTLKSMPAFQMNCSWLPVDTLASSILDVAFLPGDSAVPTVLNMENPQTFHWTRDLLPALRQAGLQFKATRPEDWLRQLRRYSESVPEDEALGKNPAIKLLDYFAQLVEGQSRNDEFGELVFDTTKAQACSASLRSAPDILEEGLVTKFVSNWMEKCW